MKKFIAFLLLFAVVVMVAIQACNKDKDEIIQPNQSPVAFAGNDTTFLITNCEPRVALRLDGHKSYDPNVSDALKFIWKQVSGPARAFDGVETARSVAYVYNLVSGEYKFELEVIDPKGLSSKDSIIVNIKNITDTEELELDITGLFQYDNNLKDYYSGENYYDMLSMNGDITISNESFTYNIEEYADSANVNTQYKNYFSLNDASSPARYISGDCTVDFDALYAKGGGAFEGTIKVKTGSAYVDCENMMPDTPLIEIRGNLNAATKTITMKIKGKIIL